MMLSAFPAVFDAAGLASGQVALFADPKARALLLAIAGQESNWTNRLQNGGPARGYWQFEIEAVQGVIANAASKAIMAAALAALDVPANPNTVYNAIAYQDVLAAVCARMLLWCDPLPLPTVGDQSGSWACYLRVWRPGKPDQSRWNSVYPMAVRALSTPTT